MRDPLLQRLSLNVKVLRHSAGLTQEQLAERSGLHLTYIGGLETARRNPTLKTLATLARALSVPITDLVAGLEVDR